MATKEEIKASAYYCFAHYGYEGTTMQDIAKAVGLKKQSLYAHFGSKEELYLKVMSEHKRQITLEMHMAYEHLKDKPAEDLLKGLFIRSVEIFSDRKRLLLWKRTSVHLGSDNNGLLNADDWPIDWSMRDELHKVLKEPYPVLEDADVFHSFFVSYLLMIQGYLEWMLVKGHDGALWRVVWTNFWCGTKSLFKPGQQTRTI
jgi:AcrR family transcriptional regulator